MEQKTRTSEDVFNRQNKGAAAQTWVYDTLTQYRPTNQANAYTPLQLTPYAHMSQGLEEDQMVGRAVYGKYMHVKVHFSFPKGEHIPAKPYEVWLIHGWLKRSPNWTKKTTPPAELGDWWRFQEWINFQLEDYFNERVDKLRFIPKRSSNFKILRKQKIVPNLTRQTGAVPGTLAAAVGGAAYQTGMVPDVSARCSWNIQRKIHYEKGIRQWNTAADADGNPTGGATPAPGGNPPAQPDNLTGLPDFYYPNADMWVPFAVIYQPHFDNMNLHGQAGQTNDDVLNYRANSIMYYTDS